MADPPPNIDHVMEDRTFTWYHRDGRKIRLNADQIEYDERGWWKPKKDIKYTETQTVDAVVDRLEDHPDFGTW